MGLHPPAGKGAKPKLTRGLKSRCKTMQAVLLRLRSPLSLHVVIIKNALILSVMCSPKHQIGAMHLPGKVPPARHVVYLCSR